MGSTVISIHKALASLDYILMVAPVLDAFQSTRLSRASTVLAFFAAWKFSISIHKALASLDPDGRGRDEWFRHFNPQGSREPRRATIEIIKCIPRFQSTRLSRASTLLLEEAVHPTSISIHKALASLDFPALCLRRSRCADFNPQGSREPRPISRNELLMLATFQSTRLSRASTAKLSKPTPHPP